MKITYMSDLHLEFAPLRVPTPEDPRQILVLAGDIGVGKKKSTYMEFLEQCVNDFYRVIYIPGNHEFYRGNIDKTWDKMKANMATHLGDQEFDRYLKMLNEEVVVIDDVAFFGATLWTMMGAIAARHAEMRINDYRLIRQGDHYGKFSPHRSMVEHSSTLYWLENELPEYKDYKKVVVTHHAPSFQSVNKRFAGDSLNPAYATELSHDILEWGDNAPDVWIHGHMHDSVDYMIGKTRVLSNPRGYDNYFKEGPENPAFDPAKTIKI